MNTTQPADAASAGTVIPASTTVNASTGVEFVNYTRAGCAVYAIGNNYYVVCNFAGTPISTEQLIEQSKPENLVPAGGNEDGSTAGFSTAGETVDSSDPDYGVIYDLFEQDRAENGY